MTAIFDLIPIVAPYAAVFSAFLILWADNIRGDIVEYLGAND